jgi:hypothetical protein
MNTIHKQIGGCYLGWSFDKHPKNDTVSCLAGDHFHEMRVPEKGNTDNFSRTQVEKP